jgi:hypothetical protein
MTRVVEGHPRSKPALTTSDGEVFTRRTFFNGDALGTWSILGSWPILVETLIKPC